MEWNSVKDKLPENHQFVLAYNERDGIHLCEYDPQELNECWVFNSCCTGPCSWEPSMHPTDWMALPKPPKD